MFLVLAFGAATPPPWAFAQPAAATPDNQTSVKPVTVVSKRVDGMWRVTLPLGLESRRPDISHRHDLPCRFEQHDDDTITGVCIRPGLDRGDKVRGRLEDDRVFGEMDSIGRFEATLETPTRFVGTILGDRPMLGAKITAPEPAPPGVDKLVSDLVAEFEGGRVDDRHITDWGRDQADRFPPFVEGDAERLGPLSSIIHVDSILVFGRDRFLDTTMELYDIEFAKGWKLCGIVVTDDLRADRFQCS